MTGARLLTTVGGRRTPRAEWAEITVKSVINRVQGMPFKWSVNPYRGCAHACVYCLDGETPILMANGTARPLRDLKPDDTIYGTVRNGRYRHYLRTAVLAHWSVRKPAYRVLLEDGTELIASGDHRFLTDRGWKFVTGADQGRARRPHLTTGSKLHRIAPAIEHKRDISGRVVESRSPLRVMEIAPLGVRELFDITTGTGDFVANGVVSHNCYARYTHWYLDQDGVNDWSSRIFVKVNAPEVLRRELARPAWQREEISIGTATDPYQPAEGTYGITRRILEALRDFRTPASLVTKSTMVIRDRDVLWDLAKGPGASVHFSLTTVDPVLAREIEPDVPPPRRRLQAMQRLAAAGIPVGVILAPVLPGITDDEERLAAVVRAARDHGARSLATTLLHLGNVTREAYFQYLEHKHPDLLPAYERLYEGKYAPKAFEARVQEVVAALKRLMGFQARQPASNGGPVRCDPAPPATEQQRLL